jgi:RNA polymerase sigma factor (sigma-70 family)
MFRSKGFPLAWVNRNVVDLLAQASLEYAEWLGNHESAESPVGWLVTCAYRRGLNLLSSQNRRPPSTSIDAVFHLADESTPTPEQQALADDRQERLRAALDCLPQRERKLLALVYFEDCSVREAGRRLGWRKSAADRHHQAALERLSAMVDRSLLSPAGLGLAAWVAVRGDGSRFLGMARRGPLASARDGTAAAVEATASCARRFAEAARRLIPFGDAASAAAAGGAGRALGACGAAVVAAVCALAVSTAIPEPSAQRSSAPPPETPTIHRSPSAEASEPAQTEPHHKQLASNRSRKERVARSKPPAGAPESAQRQGGPAETVALDGATHQQVEEEFGIEGGSGSSPAPTPSPPAEEPSPPARTGGSAPPASPAAVESEFGL